VPGSDDRQLSEETFPVVAIGASAGGLEAFGQLLEHLPTDSTMAFVLISHLQKDTKSMLGEILSRRTALPVVEATNGVQLEANHIYVIPAAADLGLVGRKLVLLSRAGESHPHLPIDHFLKDLAQEMGQSAIGVVLSGAGSDGVAGLRAVKAAGGVTFAQEPASAVQRDMVQNAIDAGVVDYVLTPADIAAELARIGRHRYVKDKDGAFEPSSEEVREALLREIFLMLRRRIGVDFSGYKRATFGRRLARRMLVTKTDSLEEYVQYLRGAPGEVEALYEDALIMVTEFFRDPDTFEYLKREVFPRLGDGRDAESPIRLWVVGCSSGEEAYSFAIALLEHFGDSRRVPIQIFGTDVNEKDIEKARAGYYPGSISAQVSSERLRRFFQETDGAYRVSSRVREMCTFARHDLTRDPPFSKLDIISCRNVLIYFDTVLQERVVPIFHYALVPEGVLVLGRSEQVGKKSILFTPLDATHHIYTKRPVRAQLPLSLLGSPEARLPETQRERLSGRAHERPLDGLDIPREADLAVARTFAPTSVVVDEKYEVVHFRGPTRFFLEHATGKASMDLFRMLREGLAYDTRKALEEAAKSSRPVGKPGVRIKEDTLDTVVDLTVTPFRSSDEHQYFVVSFAEPGYAQSKRAGAKARAGTTGGKRPEEVGLLTRELEAAREHLQAIIAERDTSTEELRAALEEVQSSNEELQSTNEELETAKEELQSINEELTTINDELETRNLDLSRAQDDLVNILQTASVPIVMLDMDLNIRRFTLGIEAAFAIVASDVGRSILDLKPKVVVPDLQQFLKSAIELLAPRMREVQDEEGRWYSMRARPYKTSSNHIEGVVLSFVDVDELKRAMEASQAAKALADALNEANAAIGSTLEFDEIVRRVMLVATRSLGADSSITVRPAKGGWAITHVQGLPSELVGTRFEESQLPQMAFARTSRLAVNIEDAEADERITADFRARVEVGSELVVPLIAKGEIVGGLLINRGPKRGSFKQNELDFAVSLAASIALALENAWLLKNALRSQELNAALAETMGQLAGAENFPGSLEALLERAATVLDANVALASFAAGGVWAVSHAFGTSAAIGGSPWGEREARAFDPHRSAVSTLSITDLNDPRVDGEFLGRLGVRSVILAPLVVGPVVTGLLLFGFSADSSPPSDEELSFVAKLASGASLASENAHLFAVEHRLAESLRERLTPPLPRIAGLEMAAAVRVATQIERVGGDFYLAFPTRSGSAMLLVGDVTGKGIAAAGLTDAILTAVKSFALIEPSPGFILDGVNEIVRASTSEPRVASALLFAFDAETGALEVASAGHPPALVCGENCRLLEVPPAAPLGYATRPYETHDHTLALEETLVLYTDGLTEARRDSDLFGEERLLRAAQELHRDGVQALSDGLLMAAQDFAGGELQDDVAILSVRRSAVGGERQD
jgi:chemotaxis methyl-accepting protein methylase/GAF domain-containing protein